MCGCGLYVCVCVYKSDFLFCVCLCVRDLPVLKMSTIWGSKHSKPEANVGLCDPPRGQGIHVYLFWTKEGERYLSHTSGEVTAEELCISAAEAIGEPQANAPTQT